MAHANPFDLVPTSGLGRSRVVRNFRSFELEDASLEALTSDVPTIKHQVYSHRFFALAFACSLILGGLMFRGAWLQVVHGSAFRASAEDNRLRIITTPAPRGIITDRNGKALVENVAEFTFGIIPADLPKVEAERTSHLLRIATAAKRPLSEVVEIISGENGRTTEFLALRDHLTYTEAMQLKLSMQDEPAVRVDATPRRHYLGNVLFTGVLGYTGKLTKEEWDELKLAANREYRKSDVIGKTGLELSYEAQLRGVSGKASVEVNAELREQKVISAQDAQPGQTLQTTLDFDVQKALSEAANAAIRNLPTSGAAAVAIDPRTGGIIALVSAPSYDANTFVSGLSQEAYKELTDNPKRPLYFRPLSGEYPSGSTVKPIIAAAALDQGVITPSTSIMSTGGIRIDKWFFPDWKPGGHGSTDVGKAIADSVNTFFYTIGGGTDTFEGLGIERMTQYARAFGLGAPTGIDLPGERGGFLPSKAWKEQTKKEPWYIGDTYHFAIGQGDLLVTPLQMALAISAIANGGTLYKPHVLSSFQSADGHTTSAFRPTALRQTTASPDAVQTVREAMRQAVTNGSARRLQSLGVAAGGKTGTAQFGNEGKTHGWFVGFAPYDHPTIAIAVIVEAGGEGHATALPIAEAGLKAWLAKGTPAS
ncbi:MAG: penicillin-binding protein 2 [Patescibacteria group bacterium]|jgi:penicillin-binding protein 2